MKLSSLLLPFDEGFDELGNAEGVTSGFLTGLSAGAQRLIYFEMLVAEVKIIVRSRPNDRHVKNQDATPFEPPVEGEVFVRVGQLRGI